MRSERGPRTLEACAAAPPTLIPMLCSARRQRLPRRRQSLPPARADTQTLCLAVQSPTRDPAYLNQRVEALLLSFGKSGAPSCARTHGASYATQRKRPTCMARVTRATCKQRVTRCLPCVLAFGESSGLMPSDPFGGCSPCRPSRLCLGPSRRTLRALGAQAVRERPAYAAISAVRCQAGWGMFAQRSSGSSIR
jgi:hypothetical protein